MKNKTTVYIYYPSFQKGGIAKILINLVNYFLKKNIKVLLFSQNVSKKYFLKSKNFRISYSDPSVSIEIYDGTLD